MYMLKVYSYSSKTRLGLKPDHIIFCWSVPSTGTTTSASASEIVKRTLYFSDMYMHTQA